MSYLTAIKKVEGDDGKNIMVFALSTCMWCKKTKTLLAELGLGYNYVDVDLLPGADQEEAYLEMGKHCSGTTSFPTVVIDGGDAIIGFNEESIRALAE